jgi:hypothetical protein
VLLPTLPCCNPVLEGEQEELLCILQNLVFRNLVSDNLDIRCMDDEQGTVVEHSKISVDRTRHEDALHRRSCRQPDP